MATFDMTAEPGSLGYTAVAGIDAPVAAVYRAYTEPDLLAGWLGPDYLVMETVLFELRHGGRWEFIHRAPDGSEHRFRGVFHGDPSPDGMTRTFEYLGYPGHTSLESVRMVADGERTIVRSIAIFGSVADRDGMANPGMQAQMLPMMERLEQVARGAAGLA